jgi:3-keto-5-aminohexanoate cleavage enzyme
VPATRDVMVMLAPNGARRTKADHPALPMTVAEIAAAAAGAAAAGAAAIHMHVRDTKGNHTLDAGLYREATAAVNAAAGEAFTIQITTEAVGRFSPAEQIACVRAVRPAAVSIALREIIPNASGEQAAAEFFSWMAAQSIAPQFILYSPVEVTAFFDLFDRRRIPFSRPFLLFVLGRYAVGQQSAPEDLDPFVAALGGRDIPWAMCAFGKRESECAIQAARLGGHVRIGFENNLLLPDGTVAPSNTALVAATVELLEREGFTPMNPAQARATMGARAV